MTCRLAASIAERPRASTRMRNRLPVLNSCCASATGMIASSSVFMPRPLPLAASTPTTRKRRSPMRTNWPSGGSAPNSSARSFAPITITGEPRSQSSTGRKLPCASVKRRMSMNSAVEPSTSVSRSRLPTLISEVPTTTGATRSALGARATARASSTVRSRGVEVMALAGLTPPVAVRPGSTITRLEPMAVNSRTT
ncbi:MAG: hypothetical protein H6R03_1691 [Burkholderiaceae bacterium]|nr:hypothetical protein [Burkholderiaceae bacterium]